LRRAAKYAICLGVFYEGNAATNTVSGQLAGADQTPNGTLGNTVAFSNGTDAAARTLVLRFDLTHKDHSVSSVRHISAIVRDSATL
jgi:hypothetical protein